MTNPAILSGKVLSRLDEHAARFRNAKPFRHVVIEDFFAKPLADALLEQFPPFEAGNARNENGEVGNKSTVDKIRQLGSAYSALDDVIQTREFLDTIGDITGIENLLYDPWYFGGGTHCNRAGQDLDSHVDFNRHPIRHWHRRLNLIVYLNHEWHDDWGGSLELHSDPRAEHDTVKAITPIFNRCVIFETTEHSWHGFPPIHPPEDRRDAMRRSVALYFYSEDRPAEELADTHSTIYVDRPLPDHIVAGRTLSEDDMREIRILLTRRDHHNRRLYKEITRLNTELERAAAAINSGRLGRLRYLLQRARAKLRR
ncbi:MAG: 2OG-Fe(II) oxygenase [Rhodanobacteraceae bacterium]